MRDILFVSVCSLVWICIMVLFSLSRRCIYFRIQGFNMSPASLKLCPKRVAFKLSLYDLSTSVPTKNLSKLNSFRADPIAQLVEPASVIVIWCHSQGPGFEACS